jgi:hypothetical protein
MKVLGVATVFESRETPLSETLGGTKEFRTAEANVRLPPSSPTRRE